MNCQEELKSKSWRAPLLARTKDFEFPWWAFLSFGALAGFFAADGVARILGQRTMEPSAVALTLVFLLTGIASGGVGLTKFARWAWKD